MRRSLTRLLFVTNLLIGLVGVLAAATGVESIGDAGGDESAPNLIANAVDLADHAGTSRVAISVDVTGSPEAAFSVRGEGVANHATGDAHVTMTFALPEGLAPPGFDEPMETIFVGTTGYLRMPILGEMAEGKPWVSFDLEELLEESADLSAIPALDQFESGDPTKTLELLRGASDEIVTVGQEELRGVATTHYRADIDLTRALDDVSPADRPLVGKQIAEYRELFGSTTIPIDVWIDGDGLPRQMRFSEEVPPEEGLPPGTQVVFTFEMFEFGVPVDVQPPPADQVFDMTAMLVGLS